MPPRHIHTYVPAALLIIRLDAQLPFVYTYIHVPSHERENLQQLSLSLSPANPRISTHTCSSSGGLHATIHTFEGVHTRIERSHILSLSRFFPRENIRRGTGQSRFSHCQMNYNPRGGGVSSRAVLYIMEEARAW